MSDSKARRLAPATPGIAASDAQKRRKNVGTACLACKTRKLKCTGAPPCANCLKSRLECTLDETADKRRRGALKRKIDQLEDKEDLLVRLVEVLRESNNRRAVPLLNLIRSNASLSEIRHYIEHQLPRSELAHTPELVDVCREVKRRQPSESPVMRGMLDAKRLSDIPRFSVPARPWTSVVVDDDLVSHLVSLWFTWVHPFCNWIDRELFIRDMMTGSSSASYCSPFLVNIILAHACAYSDYPEVYGTVGDMTSKGAHFYEEAKRLLDKEEGRITLPTVQGLGVMWTCAAITGRERQEWICRAQLAYSVEELTRTVSGFAARRDADSLRMVQEINNTNWGLFNLAMIHALSDKKTPVVKPPQRQSPPPATHDSHRDEWSPYPDQSSNVEGHVSCLFSALCDLNRITWALASLLFSQTGTPRHHPEFTHKAAGVVRELNSWLNDLPKCLHRHNVGIPHVLSLHMYYHMILMTIHGYRQTAPTQAASPVSVASAHTYYDNTISPAQSLEGCLSSARDIAGLTHVHRSHWTFDRMPVSNIYWIVAALFTLLNAADEPANRDAFIALAISARAFSRRWDTTKGILRNIQATAHEQGFVLPAETEPLFVIQDRYSSSSVGVKSETPEPPA